MAEGLAKGPTVQVATIAQGPKERLITLLGDTRPYQVATLYGKVGGYLKSIAVDRGDRVKAGQVVAEVESAETDRQYDAAVSDLENKKKNAERGARSGRRVAGPRCRRRTWRTPSTAWRRRTWSSSRS